MAVQEREKDKRVGWMVSAGFHILIILLFFLINAWTAPDPPLPEYGIELNFGLEEAGSGAQQPVTQPTPPTVEDQGEPEKQEETKPEEIVEEQPAEQPVQNTTVEELPDSKQDDSPVETKPAEKPVQVTPVPREEVKETKPVSKPAEVKPVPEPKVEEKKVDANALYPGSSSQGNKENAAGDAGDPQGKIDAKTLYGRQGGGGGGPSLDLAGWRWDYIPKPDDKSKENGRIVFEIKVNDRGDVIGVRTLEKTVSPGVEQLYRREVEKLTFSSTSENTIPAPISTGKITFIIQSN
jgi:periplasmic protein TonB